MNGFAVLGIAEKKEIDERFPFRSRIWGVDKLIQPYKSEEIQFNNTIGVKINIPPGLEKSKIKRASKIGIKNYGYSLSKTFNLNYNPFFHHSCLIRGLDFYTMSMGCDLRLNEVIIADAATYEGRNAFRLLLPIARRIILVTDKKNALQEEVNYAMIKYGSSVALIEDPVKAADRGDVIIISSENPDHKYLVNVNKPMLFFRFTEYPSSKRWFDSIGIDFNSNVDLDTIYAQGYIDINNKKPIWDSAEKDGFRIGSIKRGNSKVLER